jgi:hypothetical protein
MKFQVDNSNTFRDMLRTKMSDGRKVGRTETISISPAAFSAGDKKTTMHDQFTQNYTSFTEQNILKLCTDLKLQEHYNLLLIDPMKPR